MASVAQTLQSAVELHQAGDVAGAERQYREVLRLDPRQSDALHLIGVAVLQRGNPEAAVDYIQRAIAENDGAAPFHSNLAAAYRQIGDGDHAAASLREAVRIDPTFADAWYNLGTVLQEDGQYDEALQCFEQSLALVPDSADTHNNLGITRQHLGRWEDAVDAFRNAIAADANHAEAHDNLGTALQKLQRPEEALDYHRRALTLKPAFTAAQFNLGNALRDCDRFDDAEACYRQVLSRRPDSVDAWNNLGIVLKDKGRYVESLDAFERVIQFNPDHVEAHVNRSFVRRLTGDLERGWPEFEWRFRAEPNPRTFTQPRWDGSSLAGKTLFVYAEQGIGDEIMFASCLPDAARDAADCIVECDPRLIPLFERSFSGMRFIAADTALPAFDVQTPSGSLMQFVRKEFADFPKRRAYLAADAGRVADWTRRYDELGSGPKIGISWRGGKDPELARRRTMPFSAWWGLLAQPGVTFVNLQYGDCENELNTLQQDVGVTIHDWADSDPLQNLDDFAAKIAALDLVISIDNSTVHLAGALGVDVWTLLPYAPDWRWFLDRDDSPWYPSMRLFRQSRFGDWLGLTNEVAAALKQWV